MALDVMTNSIGGFKEIIDTYFSTHTNYCNEKVSFECEYGELIFLKTNTNVITVFGIYIFPEYRQQGLCRNILHYLIDVSDGNFNFLCIQSVLSNVLYEYLLRFTYKNKSFSKHKTGFFYKL